MESKIIGNVDLFTEAVLQIHLLTKGQILDIIANILDNCKVHNKVDRQSVMYKVLCKMYSKCMEDKRIPFISEPNIANFPALKGSL